MNAYYDSFQNKISNSRIIEGYFEEVEQDKTFGQKLSDTAAQVGAKIKALLSSAFVRRFAKPISLALSLVGIAGIIGAIEQGRMGLFAGFLLGLLVIAFEGLALRGVKKKAE